MKNLFLSIIFILIIIPLVSAVGIGPGIIAIDFKPNYNVEYTIYLYNTQQKDVTVNVYTDDSHLQPEVLNDLANAIKLDTNQVTFTKDELTKNIKATITLPSTISITGIHELRIGASEKVTNNQGINVIVANEVRVLINATQNNQEILGNVPSETTQTTTTIKQTSQETRKKLNLADYILIIFANIILIVIVTSIIYFFLKIRKRHKNI